MFVGRDSERISMLTSGVGFSSQSGASFFFFNSTFWQNGIENGYSHHTLMNIIIIIFSFFSLKFPISISFPSPSCSPLSHTCPTFTLLAQFKSFTLYFFPSASVASTCTQTEALPPDWKFTATQICVFFFNGIYHQLYKKPGWMLCYWLPYFSIRSHTYSYIHE